MSTGRQVMGLNPKFVSTDINLFLLPYLDNKDNKKSDGEILVFTCFLILCCFKTLWYRYFKVLIWNLSFMTYWSVNYRCPEKY